MEPSKKNRIANKQQKINKFICNLFVNLFVKKVVYSIFIFSCPIKKRLKTPVRHGADVV